MNSWPQSRRGSRRSAQPRARLTRALVIVLHCSGSWSRAPVGVVLRHPRNLEDCRQVARAWCLAHGCGGGLKDENCAIGKALDHFEALAFVGGLIRIDGKAVAFTAGEAINDQVFDVHFEKALDGYDGLYPAINQAFAEHALSGYRWINREEDMGLEGLRRAKASYYPAEVLEKFTAVRE